MARLARREEDVQPVPCDHHIVYHAFDAEKKHPIMVTHSKVLTAGGKLVGYSCNNCHRPVKSVEPPREPRPKVKLESLPLPGFESFLKKTKKRK